jgi:hypothetical protein
MLLLNIKNASLKTSNMLFAHKNDGENPYGVKDLKCPHRPINGTEAKEM